MVWIVGLDCWFGLMVWIDGLDCWFGLMVWIDRLIVGLERVDCWLLVWIDWIDRWIVGLDCWFGLLVWIVGLEWVDCWFGTSAKSKQPRQPRRFGKPVTQTQLIQLATQPDAGGGRSPNR